jgi:hypothetical protein
MVYLIFGAKARLNFRAWQKYISGSMRTKGEENPTRRAAIPARMLRTPLRTALAGPVDL